MIEKIATHHLDRPEAIEHTATVYVEQIYELWPAGETPLIDETAYQRCVEQERDLEFMVALFETAVTQLSQIAADEHSLKIYTAYAKYTEEILRSRAA